MTSQPESRNPLVDAALDVLRAHGPLTSEDWAELLVDAGNGSVDEMLPFVDLLDEPVLGRLVDGRTVALDALLEGRVFTHRLSEAEIRSGLLYAEPDLLPVVLLAMAADDDRVLFDQYDGDALEELGLEHEEFPDGAGLQFGAAALQGYSVGDVIGVRVRGGDVEVELVVGDLVSADLTEALGRTVGEDNADNCETVSWQLLADDPELCTTPTVPLGELISSAGYVCEGDYIAASGFDVAAHHLARHIALVARQAELHPDEVDAVISFVDLVGAVREGDMDLVATRERVMSDPESFGGLEDPSASAAALDVVSAFDDDHLPAVYLSALAVAEKGPRRSRASGHWLAGMAADLLGDVREAERHLEEAVALDEEWTPALLELAGFASDRGDATRALSLLGRIEGGEEEHLYAVLQRFAPQEHPGLGRNDKCWCGSGRKYKVCHLGKSDTTLDDRAHWLYEKAAMFAQSTTLFDLVLALADLRAEDADDEESVARAFAEPLVLDVGLFEGGLFGLFVLRRGALLPADELELAGRWLEVRRSLHEVLASADSTVTLRDLVTNETADVVVDEALEVGSLVCARVVPTGERTQILGGYEPVAADRREAVLAVLAADEVEPEDVIDVLSGRVVGGE